MSIVCPSQYGVYMSLAESPAPSPAQSPASGQTRSGSSALDGTAPPVQLLPANHLMETVLPVRPALIDRGSAARAKPGMLAELVGSGAAQAVVLSGRQALVSGNSLVLLNAAELSGHLADTPYAPEHVIYLGSALAGSDLDAGTEIVLLVLPLQFEVQAEEFEAHVAGIPGDAQWAGFREVAAR